MKCSKTILCLANSRKTSGRCVAGIEWIDNSIGRWVRPVSNNSSREISEEDRRYEDGKKAAVGDIVQIEILRHVPRGCHVEDYLIDDQYYWKKVGAVDWDTVKRSVENKGLPLWKGTESTYHGINDKLSEDNAASLSSSLVLIRPERVELSVRLESLYGGGNKKVVRAKFEMGGCNYLLKVTDPIIEEKYLGLNSEDYRLSNAILCVSLGEPYKGYVFLLVAAVLTKERFR